MDFVYCMGSVKAPPGSNVVVLERLEPRSGSVLRPALPTLRNCCRSSAVFKTLEARNNSAQTLPTLKCFGGVEAGFKSVCATISSAGLKSSSLNRNWGTSGGLQILGFQSGIAGSFLFLPSTSRRRVRPRCKLTTIRAQVSENGFVGDETEKKQEPVPPGGLSGLRNALVGAVFRFLEAFSRELKEETGIDCEAGKDRVVAKYEKLREMSGKALNTSRAETMRFLREGGGRVQSAVQVVRQRYWPQFVNWNQIELWKDIKQWDAERVGALVVYILVIGSVLRGAQIMITTPRASRRDAEVLSEAFLESVIPEPTPANVRKMKMAMWRQEMSEDPYTRKYVLGENGEYVQNYFALADEADEADEAEETFTGISIAANKLIEETELLTAEEKEQVRRMVVEPKSTAGLDLLHALEKVKVGVDINEMIDRLEAMPIQEKVQLKEDFAKDKARRPPATTNDGSVQEKGSTIAGSPLNQKWLDRLNEWEKVFRQQRESNEEDLNIFPSDVASEISLRQLEADIVRARESNERAALKIRAFWVAKKWWKFRPKLPYTYFLNKVQNLEVEAAVYTDDLKKLYVTMKEGFPTEYVVDIPLDPDLFKLLEACQVEVEALQKSDFVYLGRILVLLGPSLLIIRYIQAWEYHALEKAKEKIYDLLKMNRKHLISPEDAKEKARSQYKDVVVGGDVWQVIEEIMMYMRNPMKYHRRGVKLPRGILISGPPGTGKTLLARAIARESGLPFVFASGAEFADSSTGTGTDKVFDIFFTARANAPSFVFIDEIDALAGKIDEDDAERRATFQQLLSELDAEPEDTDVDRFAARQAVILICATNRPDELDDQFMRPGRIDREIYIGLPGEEERIGIFDVHSQGKRIGKDVDFSKLVFRTIGYSGADIRNLINEAGIMAVRKGHDEMSQEDLTEVLDKQLFEGMGVVLMDEEQQLAEEKVPAENKRILAVHEAGHVLLAHLFPTFDWHAFSHLLPGGSEVALSVFYPRQEMLHLSHTTVGYVKMQMVVAHGGRCAERLIYGDNISDGGQDDLKRISTMARELTISPANSRFGLLPLKWRGTLEAPKVPGEVELIPNEWDKPGTQIMNMSVEMSELFTREVTKYVEDTEEIAMTALSRNRHILEKLVEVLLRKTKLSGLEAGDIIKSMDPVLLPDFMHKDSKISLKSYAEKVPPPKMRGRYEEMDIFPAPLHRC